MCAKLFHIFLCWPAFLRIWVSSFFFLLKKASRFYDSRSNQSNTFICLDPGARWGNFIKVNPKLQLTKHNWSLFSSITSACAFQLAILRRSFLLDPSQRKPPTMSINMKNEIKMAKIYLFPFEVFTLLCCWLLTYSTKQCWKRFMYLYWYLVTPC